MRTTLICSILTSPCFPNITLGAGHDELFYPEAAKLNCDQSDALLVCLEVSDEQFFGV